MGDCNSINISNASASDICDNGTLEISYNADLSELNDAIDESMLNGLAMLIYPNPMGNEGTVTFSSESDISAQIEIFSSRGELVCTIFNGMMRAGENRSVQFDTSSMANGMYFCRYSAGDTLRYNKIIINR